VDPSISPAGSVAAQARRRRARHRSNLSTATEWIIIVAGALAVAFLIKTFILQAFYIPSSSMTNTLKIGDRVLVNKLSYKMHDVHRGDIVVFERPPGEEDRSVRDLIKRVIALPGETVDARDGHILINGRLLREPYLDDVQTSGVTQQTIPPNHYWVMGDNRINSKDSRVFGPIAKSLIVGRAFVRLWPLSSVHLL
jgi:signal peptidase I